LAEYGENLKGLDVDSLFTDIKNLMVDNNENWPADFGNYGPLFVRLAWHCSGTYRKDGKGGCTGADQRFEPVRSWDDNTNLDKARALLAPIKSKYGAALSWGDLIIAAGTAAMREMGTPLPQLCFGRVDDVDGANALDLGPSAQQEEDAPCAVQGQCQPPLGSTTVGLIYLNPEGPVIEAGGLPVPDPVLSAADIRDAFGRMENDDRATVALIGGGHAFGKSHGACALPDAQGIPPNQAYAQNHAMAWQGTCGTGNMMGKGNNTFTAGFEGVWTTKPTLWDNEFFSLMLDRQWEVFVGPGGHHQWRIANATEDEEGLMRLTSDVALINDEAYLEIVQEFASNISALEDAFADAWFNLTHRGGVWSANSKCDIGTIPQWILDQNSNRMLDTDVVAV